MIFAAGGGVDPATASIINLIGGLGASGAAVAVVWMFLGFLRGFLSSMQANQEKMAERQNATMKDVGDTLREFNRTSNTICRAELAARKLGQ